MKTTGRKIVRRRSRNGLRGILVVALGLMCGSAQAQTDRVWTGNASQYWFVPGNWNTSAWPFPNDRAVFTDAAIRYSLDVQGGATFNAMVFNTQTNYTFSNGTLNFGDLTTLAAGGFATHLFNTNVNLPAGSDWTIDEFTTIEVAGQFSPSGGLDLFDNLWKLGDGTLVISGDNDATPGTIDIRGGEVVLAGGSAYSDTSHCEVGSNGTLRLQDSETIGALGTGGSGAVELGVNQLTLNGPALVGTFAGTMSGDSSPAS